MQEYNHTRCKGCGAHFDNWISKPTPDFEPKSEEKITVRCRGCANIKDLHDHRGGELTHGSCDTVKMVLDVDEARECDDFVSKEDTLVRCRDCKHATNIKHREYYTCDCAIKFHDDKVSSAVTGRILGWERYCSGFEEKSCKNCKYYNQNTRSGKPECPSKVLGDYKLCGSIFEPGLWKWEAVEEQKEENSWIEKSCHDCGYLDGNFCYQQPDNPYSPPGAHVRGNPVKKFGLTSCSSFKHYSEFDGAFKCDDCRFAGVNYPDDDGSHLCYFDGGCASPSNPSWRPVVKPKSEVKATTLEVVSTSVDDIKLPPTKFIGYCSVCGIFMNIYLPADTTAVEIICPTCKAKRENPYAGKVPEKYWALDYMTCPEVELWRAARWRFTKAKENGHNFNLYEADGCKANDVLKCYFHYKNREDDTISCKGCSWGEHMGKCSDDYSAWKQVKRGEFDEVLAKIDAKIAELEDERIQPDWQFIARCNDCIHWSLENGFEKFEKRGIVQRCNKEMVIQANFDWDATTGRPCSKYKQKEPAWHWVAPNRCEGCKHWIEDTKIKKRGSGKKFTECAEGWITKCTWNDDDPRGWTRIRGKNCSDYEKSWLWEADCGDCVHVDSMRDDGRDMVCTKGRYKIVKTSGDPGHIYRTGVPNPKNCDGYKAPEKKWDWEADCGDCVHYKSLTEKTTGELHVHCGTGLNVKTSYTFGAYRKDVPDYHDCTDYSPPEPIVEPTEEKTTPNLLDVQSGDYLGTGKAYVQWKGHRIPIIINGIAYNGMGIMSGAFTQELDAEVEKVKVIPAGQLPIDDLAPGERLVIDPDGKETLYPAPNGKVVPVYDRREDKNSTIPVGVALSKPDEKGHVMVWLDPGGDIYRGNQVSVSFQEDKITTKEEEKMTSSYYKGPNWGKEEDEPMADYTRWGTPRWWLSSWSDNAANLYEHKIVKQDPPKPILDIKVEGAVVDDEDEYKRIAKEVEKAFDYDYHVLVHGEEFETKVINKEETTMKCKNCGHEEDREFAYCPDCGKSKERKGIRERIAGWLAARKERAINRWKEEIKELQETITLKELNIKRQEEVIEKGIQKAVDINKELQDTLADRDANYVAMEKKLDWAITDISFDESTRYGKIFKIEGHVKGKFPQPEDLVIFNKESLPAPDDEDEE
jgi:hypothetical protein